MESVEEMIEQSAEATLRLKARVKEIEDAAKIIVRSIKAGGKLMVVGNGGSAADAQHIAAEFVGRFHRERRALPAIALTTDTSILTAWSNDYDFETVFSRQVQGLGRKDDVLLAISTSGNSPNVLQAVKAAKDLQMPVIALTGKDGGELGRRCDIEINVPDEGTARVQEGHMLVYHLLCELVDREFA